MTKAEKVIAGLQRCCVDNCTQGSKCPYYSEKDCLTALLYEALEVVEEREPLKVLQDRECEVAPNTWQRKGFCPKCHQEVQWIINRNFCGFCGQTVKWE